MDEETYRRLKAELAQLKLDAEEALADLALAGQTFCEAYAAEHGVDPEQVQLFVTDNETTLTPVIRPNANYPR